MKPFRIQSVYQYAFRKLPVCQPCAEGIRGNNISPERRIEVLAWHLEIPVLGQDTQTSPLALRDAI